MKIKLPSLKFLSMFLFLLISFYIIISLILSPNLLPIKNTDFSILLDFINSFEIFSLSILALFINKAFENYNKKSINKALNFILKFSILLCTVHSGLNIGKIYNQNISFFIYNLVSFSITFCILVLYGLIIIFSASLSYAVITYLTGFAYSQFKKSYIAIISLCIIIKKIIVDKLIRNISFGFLYKCVP